MGSSMSFFGRVREISSRGGDLKGDGSALPFFMLPIRGWFARESN